MSVSLSRARRLRRAGLAVAALPAALMLPAAAQAATAEVIQAGPPGGVLAYSASTGEVNNVSVRVDGSKLVIADSAPISVRNGCVLNAAGDAECPISVSSISMVLGDKNDVAIYRAPHQGAVAGDTGSDIFLSGLREATPGRPVQRVDYIGGEGLSDRVSYALANRRVSASLDGRVNDGRSGDVENIGSDVEILEGSPFGDFLFGSNQERTERLVGNAGADEMEGGNGPDIFETVGSAVDGADTMTGGEGIDRVSYEGRANRVEVRLDDTIRNDGEAGEFDFVRPDVEQAVGGSGDDLLLGNAARNRFFGGRGIDVLIGAGERDFLVGGAGQDIFSAGPADDFVDARDREADSIDCGSETDRADRDAFETRVDFCETGTVG